MEYKIGDRVVYPMHGAGVIEAIEDREILGSKQTYYIVRIPFGDMQVMIPKHSAAEMGVRDVIDSAEADRVLEEFSSCAAAGDANWNKRYRENMLRIKTGNIYEIVRVVKNLMFRDRRKGLSTGERKMLASAKQILVSELVIAKTLSPEDIETLMDQMIEAEVEGLA
jgi:CarD family transcriptional regulator